MSPSLCQAATALPEPPRALPQPEQPEGGVLPAVRPASALPLADQPDRHARESDDGSLISEQDGVPPVGSPTPVQGGIDVRAEFHQPTGRFRVVKYENGRPTMLLYSNQVCVTRDLQLGTYKLSI